MTAFWAVSAYGLREALRRKVFLVVLILSLAFLALYWIGTRYIFDHLEGVVPAGGVDVRTFVGATVFGLAMFATLFLGTVLAVFLTLGVVRGDAERGLLQPLVVRPIGRGALLAARFAGAAGACVVYVLAVYFAALLITGANGDWWPDRIATPGLELAGGVCVIAGLSILGSIFLSSTANGIFVFMLFGAGLVAGLLGQIARTLQLGTLSRISTTISWLTPFEALYQDGLHAITADVSGFTRFVVELGPLGGAHRGGIELRLWALAYLLIVGAVALVSFARRDL